MIAEGLIFLDERIERMATDQATFDAALTDFLNDLNTGLAAIQTKLDAAGAQVDLSPELAQLENAKAAFDAQVSADTAPAAPAPAETAPQGDTTATTNEY